MRTMCWSITFFHMIDQIILIYPLIFKGYCWIYYLKNQINKEKKNINML